MNNWKNNTKTNTRIYRNGYRKYGQFENCIQFIENRFNNLIALASHKAHRHRSEKVEDKSKLIFNNLLLPNVWLTISSFSIEVLVRSTEVGQHINSRDIPVGKISQVYIISWIISVISFESLFLLIPIIWLKGPPDYCFCDFECESR